MSAVLLARIQFALTIGFHFLFPPTTFALTLIIVILETFFYKTARETYRQASDFLVRILGLVFVMGTATGIVMAFSFGNNWAAYARMVGDIFGAPLAAEGIFAFFLESVFLGILLFGRRRVSGRAYWWAAFLVFLGAHISGFWIIVANSWMQTPAGYTLVQGKAVLTNFAAAVFNPSTIIRYLHTVLAGWITGSLLVAAISAWYFKKNRFTAQARVLLTISLAIFSFTPLAQLVSGHRHSVQVARTQPAKMAAFEAIWQTQERAPLALFGIPVEKEHKTYLYVGIPGMLSFLIHGDPTAQVPGLNEFPPGERPPVFLSFSSYHLMIAIGMALILISLWGLWLLIRKRIETNRLYLKLLLFSAPFGYIACETGWIAAEVGRQPWAIYNILKTANAASPVVSAGQIAVTLAAFTVVYLFLFIVFARVLGKIINRGPGGEPLSGYWDVR